MNPELSVIMPVYNGERYLHDSIGCLNKIKGINWELLLLDDGSTDNSRSLIKIFADKDTRIEPFYSDQNKGVCDSRNNLICTSRSEVLLILDVDNVFDEGHIEKMFRMLKDKCIDVVSTEKLKWITSYSPLELANGFGDGWNYGKYGEKIDLEIMIKALDVPPCSGNYMYTRRVFDAVGGYRTEDYQETWGFGFRHIVAGYPIWVCPDTYYNHRVCNGQYNRLPKHKIEEAMWNRLNDIRDKFTDDTVGILNTQKNGGKVIESGVLKLK